MSVVEGQVLFFLTLAGFGLAAGVFIALFFINAPYGRHARKGWGPTLPSYLGWMIMESPSALLFVLYFLIGGVTKNLPIVLFFVMWEAHYIHRAFIYPWTIRGGQKRMPISVPVMAFTFNLGNSYINGRYLFSFSGGYPDSWLTDPRFLIGMALFVGGFITNRWADASLRGLRPPGESGYLIPYGGLFRWVSCPNYLGEIVEWLGWALMTWSLPGLAFAVWTIANLAPRALAHHKWYHEHFADYPQERKALIPGVW